MQFLRPVCSLLSSQCRESEGKEREGERGQAILRQFIQNVDHFISKYIIIYLYMQPAMETATKGLAPGLHWDWDLDLDCDWDWDSD